MKDLHRAHMSKQVKMPATAGTTLPKVDPSDPEVVDRRGQKEYRGLVGQLPHMASLSRPEISNAVREISRHGHCCTSKHLKAAKKIAAYVWQTPKRGWTLNPTRKWDGKTKDFLFKVSGKSDSNYATCASTRKSVTGYVVYLEDAPVAVKSLMQQIIALSVTEVELIALVQCVQEMFFVKKVLESMGLKVELPMTIECDNKGAVDLVNGHGVGGNTKHIDVRILHVRGFDNT